MTQAIITDEIAGRINSLLTNSAGDFIFPPFLSLDSLLAHLKIQKGSSSEATISEREFKLLLPIIEKGNDPLDANSLYLHLCYKHHADGLDYSKEDFNKDCANLAECNLLLATVSGYQVNLMPPQMKMDVNGKNKRKRSDGSQQPPESSEEVIKKLKIDNAALNARLTALEAKQDLQAFLHHHWVSTTHLNLNILALAVGTANRKIKDSSKEIDNSLIVIEACFKALRESSLVNSYLSAEQKPGQSEATEQLPQRYLSLEQENQQRARMGTQLVSSQATILSVLTGASSHASQVPQPPLAEQASATSLFASPNGAYARMFQPRFEPNNANSSTYQPIRCLGM